MGRVRVLAVAAVALVLASCSWSQYGGNAGRTGANELDSEITAANVGSLQLRWRSESQYPYPPLVTPDYVYGATGSTQASAYPLDGSGPCSGTPVVCSVSWYGGLGLPSGTGEDSAFDKGTLYVAASTGSSWVLNAYAAPGGSCTTGCMPIWNASWGQPPAFTGRTAKLAVAEGRVYVGVSRSATGAPPAVWVFDAAGVDGCSPGTCQPLWHVEADGSKAPIPTVAGGRLFVPDSDGVRVFDADSGDPLFDIFAGIGTPVSVSGERAYSVIGQSLRAFDANGVEHCTPGPINVCEAVWTAETSGPVTGGPPVVAGGRVFVTEDPNPAGVGIEVFDAAGSQGCGGAPLTCQPLWSVPASEMPGESAAASANASLLFVVGATWDGQTTKTELRSYDLAGAINCSGTPRQCGALSTNALTAHGPPAPPAVAFGRVVVGGGHGYIEVLGLPPSAPANVGR